MRGMCTLLGGQAGQGGAGFPRPIHFTNKETRIQRDDVPDPRSYNDWGLTVDLQGLVGSPGFLSVCPGSGCSQKTPTESDSHFKTHGLGVMRGRTRWAQL